MDIDAWAAMACRIDLDIIEQACEESLTDPLGRGVRVDRFSDGGTDVYLSTDVPFGTIEEHVGLSR